MKIGPTLEIDFLNRRKSKVKKKLNPAMLTLATFVLLVSPGLADEKSEAFGICSSPCAYVRAKCNGADDCSLDLCSYLYPICHPLLNRPQFLHTCWGLSPGCGSPDLLDNEIVNAKRGILNKNFAYLLLKLHPFLNQTSQFGFLTPGRMRRINGHFGTEFLGKRSNNKGGGSRGPGRGDPSKAKTTSGSKFYSLPLNKFAQAKVVKRDEEPEEVREKRLSVRGNGKVVVGSEFLGKRGQDPKARGWTLARGRMRRVIGSELLGKRSAESFDGSEFLGKRAEGFGTEFLGKRSQENPLIGSELLGKKSSRGFGSGYSEKRFAGNELLGKRYPGNEFLGKRTNEAWANGDSEFADEAWYQSALGPRIEGKDCERGSFLFESCGDGKSKEGASSESDIE